MLVAQHGGQAHLPDAMVAILVGLKSSEQPAPLVDGQPRCVCWPVVKDHQARHTEQHRRKCLEDEHPLPSADRKPSVDAEKGG